MITNLSIKQCMVIKNKSRNTANDKLGFISTRPKFTLILIWLSQLSNDQIKITKCCHVNISLLQVVYTMAKLKVNPTTSRQICPYECCAGHVTRFCRKCVKRRFAQIFTKHKIFSCIIFITLHLRTLCLVTLVTHVNWVNWLISSNTTVSCQK